MSELSQLIVSRSDYRNLGLIGYGSFGKVKKVREISTGKIYALKVIKGTNSVELQQSYLHEVEMIAACSHPGIIKIRGFTMDFPYYFVTEYYSNGCAVKYIELSHRGMAPEKWDNTAKYIVIFGTALALRYLHQKNMIHRDLKPDNIMLDQHFYPRIGDFGFSKTLTSSQGRNQSLIGTPAYMAPEIMDASDNSAYDGKKADVFSYGMTVFAILVDDLPYRDIPNVFALIDHIRAGNCPEIPNDINPSLRTFIQQCCNLDPEQRPTFDDIVESFLNSTIKMVNLNQARLKAYLKFVGEKKLPKRNSVTPISGCKEAIPQPAQPKSSGKISIPRKFETNSMRSVDKMIKPEGENANNTKTKINPQKSQPKLQLDDPIDYDELTGNQLKDMGEQFEKGDGVPVDFRKARELYQRAVLKGSAGARIKLGEIFQNGRGVPQNFAKALELYHMAADANPTGYQGNLHIALMYRDGLGVKQNYKIALQFLRKAADNGSAAALCELGIFYNNGLGVRANRKTALEYFEKSAAMENTRACLKLGLLYMNGAGVPQNLPKAEEYFVKAVDGGSKAAAKQLALCRKKQGPKTVD